MDPVSQGVLGAAAAQSVAKNEETRVALLLGAFAGVAPDVDVLFRSSTDSLLFLEYHRQFTHSFVFIPFGALLCALLSRAIVRRPIPFRRAYLFCLLGYGTHGLLDACTSYGTQLLWPFSTHRVAWNNVSVVDPLFTLPLLVGVGLAARRRSPRLAQVACAWALAYLLLGVAQRERAEAVGRSLAQTRGHIPIRLEAKPAFGNLWLWKTIYDDGERYHVDATRLGWRPETFEGESAPRLDVARDLPWLDRESQQARDLERFRWYSDGYVALDPERANHVIDARYSTLPNRIQALWGIELSPARPAAAHASFYTSRDVSREDRDALLRLLFD